MAGPADASSSSSSDGVDANRAWAGAPANPQAGPTTRPPKPTPAPRPLETASPGPWADAYPGVVLCLDAKAAILSANARLSGLDVAEMLGVAVTHFVAEGQRPLVHAAIQDAAQLGLSHTLEVPLLDAGGASSRWYLASISPMPLPSGKPGVLVTALDITQRRREHERLEQAEHLLEDTQGITHIGTWYWDITQPHAQWSEELYEIYGLPRSHVPTYQDYLTRIHPEDVERVKAATEAVFKDRRPYSHDERIRHTDGTWRWLHTWARAIEDPQGKLVALAGICQDISDRKKAEEAAAHTQARFHALFERSALGVAILDGQGRILQANAALRALSDMPQDDMAGRSLDAIFDPDSAAVCRSTLLELASGGASGRQLELALRRPGGLPTSIRLTLAIVPAGSGTSPFTVAILEDRSMAQRALAADQLAMARLVELRQVEEVSERHRQLLHVASHELKNPLTPVRMQLHMLERGMLGPLNEAQQKSVTVANKQIQRITRLLQDVLDVARIEQGQLSVKPERMEAAGAVARVEEAFHDVARDWGVDLQVRSQPGLWIDADPERLEQALVNLVSNALKFTPERGHVEVTAERDGRQVALRVHDTGPGMDANQRARLFKAFSQVHAAGASRQSGTGLGLYIARNIVTALHGSLEVASEPGQGSTFTMLLPAAPAPPSTP